MHMYWCSKEHPSTKQVIYDFANDLYEMQADIR